MFPEVYMTGLLLLGYKSPSKMMTVCPHHKDLILEETLQVRQSKVYNFPLPSFKGSKVKGSKDLPQL